MEHALKPEWHPLNLIDEYLQARGWTNDGTGWLAPVAIREELEIYIGHGHLRRSTAARIQIDIDERVFA
jgi:hypothetical protein